MITIHAQGPVRRIHRDGSRILCRPEPPAVCLERHDYEVTCACTWYARADRLNRLKAQLTQHQQEVREAKQAPLTPEEARQRRYEASCKDKGAYTSRARAKRETKRMKKLGYGPMSPYQCLEFCGLWHYGHTTAQAVKIALAYIRQEAA